ncbi:hypothetical protein [Flavobacterium sp. NKUCC04_CG]|uniref:hypothetical protein n=1 Tax=Flavobacterium sp. NKUCC04_CG TaxID=2842121 RepID=UPI001C5ACDF9|nr:hypothetical protein [Flavobacterium sp. NKUCC04_CG]MBW3519143.1 hypothetical protein [Flavobacterium sp. NKUCC04_CG]
MKNNGSLLGVLVIFLGLCLGSISMKASPGIGENKFKFKIFQNGKEVVVKNHAIELEPTTFQLKFLFDNPMGILVHASFKDQTYKDIVAGKPLSQIPTMETGMAEELYNPSESIIIEESAPSYWFFDNTEEHRFDDCILKEDIWECTRTVDNFNYVFKDKLVNVSKAKVPLYLILVSSDFDEQTDKQTEYQREYIVIKWKK